MNNSVDSSWSAAHLATGGKGAEPTEDRSLRRPGLIVNKVIHNGDVDVVAIVGAGRRIAVFDADAVHHGVGKQHAEKDVAFVERRRRERAERPVVDIEKLERRIFRTIDVDVDRAEAADDGRRRTARHEEFEVNDVAANR
jgi:hypothetical protein